MIYVYIELRAFYDFSHTNHIRVSINKRPFFIENIANKLHLQKISDFKIPEKAVEPNQRHVAAYVPGSKVCSVEPNNMSMYWLFAD